MIAGSATPSSCQSVEALLSLSANLSLALQSHVSRACSSNPSSSDAAKVLVSFLAVIQLLAALQSSLITGGSVIQSRQNGVSSTHEPGRPILIYEALFGQKETMSVPRTFNPDATPFVPAASCNQPLTQHFAGEQNNEREQETWSAREAEEETAPQLRS